MDQVGFFGQLRYWMAVLLVVAVPPTIGWWLLVHPFARWWRRLGAKGSMIVLLALYFAAAALLFVCRDILLLRDLGFRPWLAVAGIPFLVVSGIIARKRKRHLDWRTLVGIPEVSSESGGSRLLCEGIYAAVRNPRYLEFDVGLIGWALIVNYLGVYLMVAVTVVAFHGIVLLEERELRERFGEAYVDYCARVPRYLPRLRGPAAFDAEER